MKHFFSFLAAAAALFSCSQNKQVLVVSYSQTGITKKVAEEFQRQLGADIECIEVEDAYDGNYTETIDRCQREMAEGKLPVVKPLSSDLSKYDMIFVGYPIWFGTCALPMLSWLESVDLAGKTIVPFCTFGSGGLNTSTADIRKAEPEATVFDGYGVRAARIAAAPKEITRFLVENGYRKGKVVTYEDYSAQREVTTEDVRIFNDACSDYQFPLGVPVSVGLRKTSDGIDYKFTAISKGMDGNESEVTIFVTAPNEGKAEFTQVVR